MKNIIILLFIFSTITTFSCHAPVNLYHDTAKMLEKDELKLTGNYANYYPLITGFQINIIWASIMNASILESSRQKKK